MSKTFAFTFNINCLLDRSLQEATQKTSTALNNLGMRSLNIQKEMKALKEEMRSGAISTDQFNTRMNALSRNLGGANQRLATFGQKLKALNFRESIESFVGWGFAARNAIGVLGTIVGPAMEFEKSMSKVGAITNASQEDMRLLSTTARVMGSQTQFSATQAAEAMSYLGMAGWKATDIAKGLPGLLSLAAAGGTDLARTADIVSDNLTAFGLSTEQSAHMADVYATVITSTNTNVEMLGETMKYAAPVAHAFGASMEETAALAGLMANSGIKASQAGTTLRAGFLRLAGPPKMAADAMAKLGMSMSDISAEHKEASAAMESLGIQLSDTKGPKKMSAILTELRNKTAALGREQKLATLKTIFGTEAATGWLAVLESGDGVFEKLVSNLENSAGSADNMAKKMQNNASGALIRLQSAGESLAISLGSTLLPTIANTATIVADCTSGIAAFAAEHPALIGSVLELGATFGGLMVIYKGVTMAMAAYRTVTVAAVSAQMLINAAMAANPIGLVIAGVGMLIAIGYQLYKNWDNIKELLVSVWEGATSALTVFWDNLRTTVTEGVNWLKSKWEPIVQLLNTPIFGSFSMSSDSGNVASNATGGIYGKGAFLTTFAESDGESAIPHTPNARNIGLLAKTNEIMGNPLGGSITATFAPNITINGGGDTNQIRQTLENEMEKFRRMLQELQHNQRRVSYV